MTRRKSTSYLAAMPDDLALRKAVIGGETKPDDFIVIWDEVPISRLFRTIGVGGGWRSDARICGRCR
ncbi:hypothetical protein [Bradyrhizobium genosp. A]|uniref:hypothetical protein n=1 Tax=Bradyrhizobium genosp. A TaxID=83626 RepID=UPI003CEE2478